jgi:death-on-curing protein
VTADAPRFVSVAQAVLFHDEVIAAYDGFPGIRDRDLLESAVAAPAAAVADGFLHDFPWGMAAAYLFHIVRNHAFMDGNKRTAYGCMRYFLSDNGVALLLPEKERIALPRRIAEKEISEAEVAGLLESRA